MNNSGLFPRTNILILCPLRKQCLREFVKLNYLYAFEYQIIENYYSCIPGLAGRQAWQKITLRRGLNIIAISNLPIKSFIVSTAF